MLLSTVCNAGDLRVLKSRHYTIHTDLDQALAEDLAQRMDAMFGEYERRLADFKADEDVPQRFEAYLFQHKAGYDRLTNNRFPNTGGIFMAGSRNLLAAFLEEQGRDAMRRTLQHEAFHQFAYTRISRELPIWLNEGLAQLFEEGIWTGRQFLIGQVPPRRVRQLQSDIQNRSLTDFKTFLSQSDEKWANNLTENSVAGAIQYNQAWAMVHFLVYAKPEYRQRMLDLLAGLHNGEAKEKAFEKTFSDNYAGFQKRFIEWANDLKPSTEAMMIEYQQVLADMLVAFNNQDKRFESIQSFQQAVMNNGVRLRYSKGNQNWNTARDPRVYFSDITGRPLDNTQLFFDLHAGRPLPDIVRRLETMKLRTVFYDGAGKAQYETRIEP